MSEVSPIAPSRPLMGTSRPLGTAQTVTVGSAQGKPNTELWAGLFWEANKEATHFPKYIH